MIEWPPNDLFDSNQSDPQAGVGQGSQRSPGEVFQGVGEFVLCNHHSGVQKRCRACACFRRQPGVGGPGPRHAERNPDVVVSSFVGHASMAVLRDGDAMLARKLDVVAVARRPRRSAYGELRRAHRSPRRHARSFAHWPNPVSRWAV